MADLNKRNNKLKKDNFYNQLSKEVQLLFMITAVFMYEGTGNLVKIIQFCDNLQKKENDIYVLVRMEIIQCIKY